MSWWNMEPDDISQIARFLRGQNLINNANDCGLVLYFGTWPATSVGQQGSELRSRSVWSLLRFARRSSERVEICSDSQLTCHTALSCSSPTVRGSVSRQWPLPYIPKCDSRCDVVLSVGRLADVIDVYIERQCAISSYSEASDTGRWLDADGLEVKCAC